VYGYNVTMNYYQYLDGTKRFYTPAHLRKWNIFIVGDTAIESCAFIAGPVFITRLAYGLSTGDVCVYVLCRRQWLVLDIFVNTT
jgi:hypothetical protein